MIDWEEIDRITNGLAKDKDKDNWLRIYGSPERVEWIHWHPCVVSHKVPCDNVHVKTGGVGYKAGYEWIVPMTHALHQELHQIGIKTFQKKYGIDLIEKAIEIAEEWDASQPNKRR